MVATKHAVYDTETADLLTVIKLSAWLRDFARSRDHVRLPMMPKIDVTPVHELDVVSRPSVMAVTLFPRKIISPAGGETLFFFVSDWQNALRLEPAALSGQQRLLSDKFEEGFGAGLIAGLALAAEAR